MPKIVIFKEDNMPQNMPKCRINYWNLKTFATKFPYIQLKNVLSLLLFLLVFIFLLLDKKILLGQTEINVSIYCF